MASPTASELALNLADRLVEPSQRSFYALINAVSALRNVLKDKAPLISILDEAAQQARWELSTPPQLTGEYLILAKSRLSVDLAARRQWLDDLKEKIPDPGDHREVNVEPRRRGVWVTIVALNQAHASPKVLAWARDYLRAAEFRPDSVWDCSHLVFSQALFGLDDEAASMARRILAARGKQGASWGSGNLTLTLRVAVNLLSAKLPNVAAIVTPSDLGPTIDWLKEQLQETDALDTRQLAIGVEFLALIGVRGHRRRGGIESLLTRATTTQCGARLGNCPHKPSRVEADVVFYATSFELDFNNIRAIVREVLEGRGLRVIDTEHSSLLSINEMPCRWCSGIGRALFVIADLTALDRPNVPFELGYALGQGKRILILYNPDEARSRGYAKFMSDLPHLARVQYNSEETLRAHLDQELVQILGE